MATQFPSAGTRLVFRCADPSAPAEEYAALLAAIGNDAAMWQHVVVLAGRELAVGALWRSLRPHASALPPVVVEHLQRGAMVEEFRMRHLAARLAQTVAALGIAEVPVLLLKGAAVGAVIDPSFVSRPMTDLDLLVPTADIARAHEALLATGWTQTSDPLLLHLLADGHHLPPYLDAQMPGVRLELHTALLPPDSAFGFDAAAFWADASTSGVPFAGARIPSRAHQLVHASAHFAWQHAMGFGAWRTLRSVALLLESPSFEWPSLVRLATASRAVTSVYWTLRVGAMLAGLRVPPDVLAALAPPTPESLRAALTRHFITSLVPGEGPVSPSARLSWWLWRMALRPRWSGHPVPRRWEADQRWIAAYESAQRREGPDPLSSRMARHAGAYRQWWAFASRTLWR
ncbi:MAG: nucleotidyltransferase family protein [Gemmatimonadaceae bacterium]